MSITIAGITVNASQTNIDQVQDAYVAYYGRGADIDGLKYWSEQLEAQAGDLNALVDAFGNSAESTALYGGLNNTQLINNIYQQVLGRTTDNAGLNFYLDLLTSKSAAFIALDIYNGAKNASPATSDTTLINNKFDVATKFTEHLDLATEKVAYAGESNAQIARDMLSTVTNTTNPTTFDVDTTIATIVNGQATSQNFTTTVGESLTGLGTFSGVISSTVGTTTLNVGDSANGTGSNDTLKLILDGANYNGGATLTGLENVEITSIASASNFLATDLGTSPSSISSSNSTTALNITDIQSLSTKIAIDNSNSNLNSTWDSSLLGGNTSVGIILNGANGQASQSIGIGSNIESANIETTGNSSDINGFTGANLSTLDISGNADLRIQGTLTNITNINASDATMTGSITLDAIGAGSHALFGGAANDQFTFTASSLDSTDTIDGNGGTADILSTILTSTIANPLNITDIETLSINATNNISIDMGNVTGIETLQINADSSTENLNLNNIQDLMATLEFYGDGSTANQFFDSIALTLTAATNTNNDTLAISTGNQGTSVGSGNNLSANLTANDIENFNISYADGDSILDLTSSSAKNVTLTGNSNGDILNLHNPIENITLLGNTDKTIDVQLPTTNTINTIDLSSSAGADTIELASAISGDNNASVGHFVINGFNTSKDILDISSFNLHHGTGQFESAAAGTATDANTEIRAITGSSLTLSGSTHPSDALSGFDTLIAQVSSSFTGSTSIAASDTLLFAVDDGSDTYLFHFDEQAGNNNVDTTDNINLVGILDNVLVSSLGAANFIS